MRMVAACDFELFLRSWVCLVVDWLQDWLGIELAIMRVPLFYGGMLQRVVTSG